MAMLQQCWFDWSLAHIATAHVKLCMYSTKLYRNPPVTEWLLDRCACSTHTVPVLVLNELWLVLGLKHPPGGKDGCREILLPDHVHCLPRRSKHKWFSAEDSGRVTPLHLELHCFLPKVCLPFLMLCWLWWLINKTQVRRVKRCCM